MKHLLFAVITGASLRRVGALSGCVPLVVGAAVAAPRWLRPIAVRSGAQTDDEAIELKIANHIGTGYGDRVHVNVTSYNGIVLLTGEVPTPDIVASIGDIARTTAKVRVVHNEIVVAAASPLGSRTNDSYITSKVKTRFVETNKFSATHVKVVTDRAGRLPDGTCQARRSRRRGADRQHDGRRRCASSSCSSRSARRFRASRARWRPTPVLFPSRATRRRSPRRQRAGAHRRIASAARRSPTACSICCISATSRISSRRRRSAHRSSSP